MVAPPNPPYVGPAKWKGAANNKPIKRIVIHCTAGSEPGVEGAARNTVAYAKRTDRPSSFHYVRDAKVCLQYVYDSVVAFHAPPNQHSIGYELCCSLANKGKGHWDQADHKAMLRGAAKDVARLCLAYGVPIRKIGPATLKAGGEGICGHDDVRDAWGQTDHWDPGPYFPWNTFIKMVQDEAKALQGTTEPKPKPTPVSSDLKFRHISLQFSDPAGQTKHDCDLVFDSWPHVVTFTEAGKGQNPEAIAAIKAKAASEYHLYFDGFDCAVAVKKSVGKLVASGYQKVIPGVAGDHPNVGIAWVTVDNPKLGRITVAAAHWILEKGKPARHAQNVKLSQEMAKLLAEKGKGSAISFFAGDVNQNDKNIDVMPNTDFTTVWDELEVYPDTSPDKAERTIDVIGTYDLDGRVSVVSARTLVSKFYTDHLPIEAIINVDHL